MDNNEILELAGLATGASWLTKGGSNSLIRQTTALHVQTLISSFHLSIFPLHLFPIITDKDSP